MTTTEPTYSTDNLPDVPWLEYRKKVSTKMTRIDGPFTVETSEGPLHCSDGYLAIDARGYPYPIAADEQALIYEPAPGLAITPEHSKALSYHPLTPGRAETHEALRAAAKAYADIVDQLCPPSREHSLAFTAIQESLMWANAAVAIHDPNAGIGRSEDDD